MTKSKIFLYICLFFICGIFFGSLFSVSIWILIFLAGCISPFVFAFGKNKKIWTFSLLFIFFILGFVRAETTKLSKNELLAINKYDNQTMRIEGKVTEMPEIKNGKQKLLIDKMESKNTGEKIEGRAIVYLERYPEFNVYDEIEIDGKFKIPEDFDGFEYKNYLFSKNIYYVLYYPEVNLINGDKHSFYAEVISFRKKASEHIKKIFPSPQSGIINAMILGIKSDISNDILESFNRTGTRHIIAISGLHMTIVAAVFMFVLLAIGISRNYAFYFSIPAIVLFVIMSGVPPSAVRAAIMGIIVLLAVRAGRLTKMTNAIVFAGAIMLLLNPGLLRFDVGFQLSFAAVLGIVLIFPKLDSLFEKYPDIFGLKTIVLITISAQAATLPILVNNFEGYSLSSIFANMLILPFVPIVMIGSFLVLLVGFLNLFAAQIIFWPIWLILTLQLNIVNFFAGIDFGYFQFNKISIFTIIVYYAILLVVIKFSKKNEFTNNSRFVYIARK